MEESSGNRGSIWSSVGWTRLYDRLLAGFAHDLAGRASALQSLALVGRRGAPNDSFVLDELEAESQKLARLVDSFLALPSPGSGLGPRAGWTDPAILLSGVTGLLSRHHDLSNIDLECSVASGTPSIPTARNLLIPALLVFVADVASQAERAHIAASPTDDGLGTVIDVTGREEGREADVEPETEGTRPNTDPDLPEADVLLWAAEIASMGGVLERLGEAGWRLVFRTDASPAD